MALKKLDADTWFEYADQFQLAALLLLASRPVCEHGPLARPHIVLKAFSTEAYLKSLIELEGKIAPPVHNLHALFQKLDVKSKRVIRRRWNADYAPRLRQLRKQKDRPRVKVPISIEGVLKQSGDAFVVLRYMPKGGEAAFTIMNLPLIVREHILTLRPEWRPKPNDPLAFVAPRGGLRE